MKKIIYFISVVFFASCYSPRYVYSPAAHNVPMLHHKGEAKLGVNASLNFFGNKRVSLLYAEPPKNKSAGADIQGAYALSEKWSLQASVFYRKERNSGGAGFTVADSNQLNYTRILIETGLGYTKKLKTDGSLLLQIFAGMGFGKFTIHEQSYASSNPATTRFHNSNVVKAYVQPALIFYNQKHMHAALSQRLSVLYYTKIKTDYSNTELSDYYLDDLAQGPVLFWEPAFVNNFSFKKLPGVMLEYQLGFSLLLNHKFVDARSFNLSAGFVIDPGKLKKHKN